MSELDDYNDLTETQKRFFMLARKGCHAIIFAPVFYLGLVLMSPFALLGLIVDRFEKSPEEER